MYNSMKCSFAEQSWHLTSRLGLAVLTAVLFLGYSSPVQAQIPVTDAGAIAGLTKLDADFYALNENLLYYLDRIERHTDKTEQHTDLISKLQTLQTQTSFSLNQMRALRDMGMLLQADPNGRISFVPIKGFKFDDDGNVIGKGAGLEPGKFVSPRFHMPIDKLVLPSDLIYIEPRSATQLGRKTNQAMNKLTDVGIKYLTDGIGQPHGWSPFPAWSASISLSGGDSNLSRPLAPGAYLRPLMGTDSFGNLDGAFKFLVIDNWSSANALKFDLLMSANFSDKHYDPRVGLIPADKFTPLEPAYNKDTLSDILTGGLLGFFDSQMIGAGLSALGGALSNQAAANAAAADAAGGDGSPGSTLGSAGSLLSDAGSLLSSGGSTRGANNPYIQYSLNLGMQGLMMVLENSMTTGKFTASDEIVQMAMDASEELSIITKLAKDTNPQLSNYSLIPKSVQITVQTTSTTPTLATRTSGGSSDEADAMYRAAEEARQAQNTAADTLAQQEKSQNPNGKVVSFGPLTNEQEQWTNVRVAVERRLAQIEVQQAVTDAQVEFNASLVQQLTDMYAQLEKIQSSISARSSFGNPAGFNSDLTGDDPRKKPIPLTKNVLNPDDVGPGLLGTAVNDINTLGTDINNLTGSKIPSVSGLSGGTSGLSGGISDLSGGILGLPGSLPAGAKSIPQLAQTEVQIEQFMYQVQKDNFELKAQLEKLNQRIHDELMRLDEIKVSMDNQVSERIRSTSSSLATVGYANDIDYGN
jgi:hypothetical protein